MRLILGLLPALLLAMFCTESVTNTLVFTNINGCILLAEVLFFRWLLDGKVNHQWLAGAAIGLSLVVKPLLGVLLLLQHSLKHRQRLHLAEGVHSVAQTRAVQQRSTKRPPQLGESAHALEQEGRTHG